MPKTQNRAVMIWLFLFAFFVAFLVVWGGYTRLSRSGLSIVEWNPVSGALPPLSQQAWQEEFAKYQRTPEFIQVNSNMTLDEYEFIFYIEWFHRLLARAVGLVYALPVFFFLFTKRIPWKEFGVYFGMGLLFISQAFAGWYMVASGLVDRPVVSHYLLTVHLFLALTLLGAQLLDGARSLARVSRRPGQILPALQIGAGLVCHPLDSDRLRRFNCGIESRSRLEYLAVDVWSARPEGPAQRASTLDPEPGRHTPDGGLHPSLVRVRGARRRGGGLFNGGPPQAPE